MKLSPNFTLDEMVVSQTGSRLGLHNVPPPWAIKELQRLATLILQPLRDHLSRPIVVTSGYRSPDVNVAVGGAANSAHLDGRAADIIVPGMTPLEVCFAIKDLGLPFDQLIHEFRAWTHVAVAREGAAPRRELLTAIRGPYRTVYTQGLT